jgi:L-alanine-DL-glutamate epimerase-like enolase superfamily enzyme
MSKELDVEVWRVPSPLPNPVGTAVGLFDTFFHLVVVIRGDGLEGWGYSGMATSLLLDQAGSRALALLETVPHSLDSLLAIEHFEQTWPGATSDTAGKGAANAIALAAWDLAGRRLGLSCADLWGRRPGTDSLDCYGSGFFLDASIEGLVAEAAQYRAAGFRLVKMRTGLPVQDDIERYETIRASFPDPGSIAVDAFHSWSPEQALDFVRQASSPLLWVEDATPYADLGQIATSAAPVAAGESLETTADLTALRSSARVDFALLDLGRLGGPMRWLSAAHVLAAAGARIGGHIYTAMSSHLLACVDDPLPVEVFDWDDGLMEAPPGPGADGRLAVAGPGFGLVLRRDTLRRHGQRLR